MQGVRGLGRAFWIGLLLMILSVPVWFIAPATQSCVTDFDLTVCETTWVVALNALGLVLFVVGGGLMFFAGGLARSRARQRRASGGDDTR